jgi:hypothetical protein
MHGQSLAVPATRRLRGATKNKHQEGTPIMARAGNTAGAFKGAHRGAFGKVGVGRKVATFNGKLPGGGGATKKGRVVVASNARGHGQGGLGTGIVSKATSRKTPGGHAKPGQAPRALPAGKGNGK